MPASIPRMMSGSAISSVQLATSSSPAGARRRPRKSPANPASHTIAAARTGTSVRRMSRVADRTRWIKRPSAARASRVASPERSGSTTDIAPGWWPRRTRYADSRRCTRPRGSPAGSSRISGMVARKSSAEHEHSRGDHDPGGATVEAAAREGQDDVHDERPYEEAGNAAGAVDPGVPRERQRHHRDRRAQGDEQDPNRLARRAHA